MKTSISNGTRKMAHNLDEILLRWEEKYKGGTDFAIDVSGMDAVGFSQHIKSVSTPGLLELKNDLSIVIADTRNFINETLHDWARKKAGVTIRKSKSYLAAIHQEISIRKKSGVIKSPHEIACHLIVERKIMDVEEFRKLFQEAKKISKESAAKNG